MKCQDAGQVILEFIHRVLDDDSLHRILSSSVERYGLDPALPDIARVLSDPEKSLTMDSNQDAGRLLADLLEAKQIHYNPESAVFRFACEALGDALILLEQISDARDRNDYFFERAAVAGFEDRLKRDCQGHELEHGLLHG